MAAVVLALCALASAAALAAGPLAAPRAGALLVATERLGDPNFSRTVLLLLEADAGGALGVILNRPLAGTLDRLLPDLPDEAGLRLPLYRGGPVQRERVTVLVRTDGDAPGLLPVLEDVKASVDMRSLQALMRGTPPVTAARAYLGYAGWAPGQLENEMARGDWLLLQTTAAQVFDTPVERLWPELYRRGGGTWVRALPGPGDARAAQSPSRSTSTPRNAPSRSTSTTTRIGWQHTEQSST